MRANYCLFILQFKAAPTPRPQRNPYVANVSREVAHASMADAQGADEILGNKPIGSFLIRPSTTLAGKFVLAVKTACVDMQTRPSLPSPPL